MGLTVKGNPISVHLRVSNPHVKNENNIGYKRFRNKGFRRPKRPIGCNKLWQVVIYHSLWRCEAFQAKRRRTEEY